MGTTTKVYTDAYVELKKLKDEISGLKVEKDGVERLTKEAQVGLTDVENRSKEFQILITELVEVSKKVVEETRISMDTAFKLIRESRDVIQAYIKEIEDLSIKVNDSKKELENVIIESKARHEEMLAENEKMEFQQRDLNIYRARLEKFIHENNLSMKIL